MPALSEKSIMKLECMLFSFILLTAVSTIADDNFIWVEGESPKSSGMHPHGWYDSVKTGMLSGNKYISNFSDKEGLATYEFEAASAGSYEFWARINPIGSKISYQLNGAEWASINTSQNVGSINLATDNKPDLRFIAWSKAGSVNLKKGPNTITFKMHSDNNKHGYLDCFIFSLVPFQPNGALKPGQKLNLADAGKWAFEPDFDTYKPGALFDLRLLNEKTAGQTGYVKTTPDGGFALGNGKPVRFWAVNSGVSGRSNIDELRAHARFLAKRGVNMVRHHGAIYSKNKNSQLTDVDDEEIKRIQMTVVAMKECGIYSTFSPYWAVPAQANPNWGLKGHPTGSPMGMLFWDKTMQSGYKAWIKELLTRPNPYDKNKTPLAKDPSVAIFQIQNEDSMLFWTMQGVKGEEKTRLDAIYSEWLKKKGKTTSPVLNLRFWEIDNAGQELKDTIYFLTETMHQFNTEIAEYIRGELGCKALINAGNWHTANEVKLLDLERWSYSANEVMGVNKYVDCVHINPSENHKAGYLVSKGDYFTDESKLLNPRKLATNLKQPAGFPIIISESTWVPPQSHQSEGPFMVAAYSSLTGVDVYYWFSLGQIGFDPTLNKWQAGSPCIMGGWPAASLMFRMGYIKQGAPVVHEERALADMWDLRPPIIAEDESFDPNRYEGNFGKLSNIQKGVNPLAYLVGPVEVKYSEKPAASKVIDLTKYIDEEKKIISSITGELTMDYSTGLCTLDAPNAKGATGFLGKAGVIRLGSVAIQSENEYATVLIVSLDSKPLETSGKILIQVTTKDRPYGWKESPATFQSNDKKTTFKGKRIDDTGSIPWNVDNTILTIALKNPGIRKATLLDSNFYPAENGDLKGTASAKGTYQLKLPENAMYVVLQ